MSYLGAHIMPINMALWQDRKRYISVMCFDKHVLRSFCGWSVLTTITYNMGICGQKWPNHVAPEYNSKLSVTFLGLGMFIWWRHQMETFSALLALCVGNSSTTGEFPTQRQEARSFDVFFHQRLNRPLSKQSWGWWSGTPSRPLWRHCNGKRCSLHFDACFHVCYQSIICQWQKWKILSIKIFLIQLCAVKTWPIYNMILHKLQR